MNDYELITKEYERLMQYEREDLYPRENAIRLLGEIKVRLVLFTTLKAGRALEKVEEAIMLATEDLNELKQGFKMCKENIL